MTTVPTPLEFVAELADTPLTDWGINRWRCRWCGSIAASGPVHPHAFGCPVIRAQQVRDAARGAVEVVSEGPPARSLAEILRHPPTLTLEPTAPVSPGVGPLVGDEGLVEKLALAQAKTVDCRCVADEDGPCRLCTEEAEEYVRTVDAHLSTRALRPAREVAHELCDYYCSGPVDGTDHTPLCDNATAAIERDRAGGRR